MKMEHPFVAEMAPVEGVVPAAVPGNWLLPGIVAAAAMLWIAAWYGDTVRAMVETWNASQTYAHGFLVVPVSAWLVWRERFRLAPLQPRPDFRVLPLLALPGLAWLLGDLAAVRAVQQFALVFMIVLAAWTLLGSEVSRRLAFPLLFLLFAVPVGDFLLPTLMEYTARFTVLAVAATGVPVYREGMTISVPTGDWSVVEACAGLRYLVACFTGGVLYAYLRYRSLSRRLAFVAAAAAVPVVANWIRAYVIVMIGEISGGKLAVGVDHLLYGWVFFGMVTMLLFGIGSVWREDVGAERQACVPLPRTGGRPRRRGFATAALAAAIATAVWPAAAWRLDAMPVTPPDSMVAPEIGGWYADNRPLGDWRPQFEGRASIERVYVNGGQRVALHLAYYRDQRHGPELVSSLNRLVSGEDRWKVVSEGVRKIEVGNLQLVPIVTTVQGGPARYLVWRWYWVDGVRTASPYVAKLLQVRSQLLGRGDDGAMVVMYAQSDETGSLAAQALEAYAAAALPAINRTLEHARSP